jgi:hypothetical protein
MCIPSAELRALLYPSSADGIHFQVDYVTPGGKLEYKRSGDKITVWDSWQSRSNKGKQTQKTVLEGVSTVVCRQ